jgi:hypothetical protein
MIMFATRTLISLLASLAVVSAILAATTAWLLLHDPVSLTTTHGNLLVPIVQMIGHAILELVRRL